MMNDPQVARVCRVCGVLFVPEKPHFYTCSMSCATKRVEIVLDELARNLAGEDAIDHARSPFERDKTP